MQITKITLDSATVDAGGKLTGSFTLQNQGGQAVSDLRYKMRLFEKPLGDNGKGMIDNSPRVPVDTQISPDNISLNYLEEKTVKFSYSVPQNLISDEHLLVIEACQSSGEMLNWDSAKITVNNASGKYVSIYDESTLVNGKSFGAEEGIGVSADMPVQAVFKVNNNVGLTNISEKVVVYYRDTILDKITEESHDLTLKNGINNITLDLPKMEKPGGSYLAVVKLTDQTNNEPISNEARFRWVVQGVSAHILSATLDSFHKDAEKKIIPLLVNYAGPADGSDGGQGTLKVDIKSGSTTLASGQKDVALYGVNNANVDIDVSKVKNVENNTNLTAEVTIQKDGKTLDSYSLKLDPKISSMFLTEETTPASAPATASKWNAKTIGYGIAVIILIAIIGIIVKKRKNAAFMILFLLLLAGVLAYGLYGGVSEKKADAASWVNDIGTFSNLSAAYNTNLTLQTNISVSSGYTLELYVTDAPIDFTGVTLPIEQDGEFATRISAVRYAHLPNKGHISSATLTNPIPQRSEDGEYFQGGDRYIYVTSRNMGSGIIPAIAHVKLPAPQFAVSDYSMDYTYSNGTYWTSFGAYFTNWDYPQANSSYSTVAPTDTIRFKGTLGYKVCGNALYEYFLGKKMRFAITEDDIAYQKVQRSFGYGGKAYPNGLFVDPDSLSSSNYKFLDPDFDTTTMYDVTYVFPNAGNLGTAPGLFDSGPLKAYAFLRAADGYITAIADAPVNYTAPTQTLSAAKAGVGSGTITSTPAGIDCGATCSAPFTKNSNVVLTATAATGSTFSSWTGCTSVIGNTCTVKMDADKTVTGTFNLIPACTPDGTYTCNKTNTSNTCTAANCGKNIITSVAVCKDNPCGSEVANSLCGSDCVGTTQACPACGGPSWKEVAP